MYDPVIWPERYHPNNAAIYGLNDIDVEAPPHVVWRLLVDGDETGPTAYHGWVITPTTLGCHLLTEETQHGAFFLEMVGRQNPGLLYRYHQKWVESLARVAEEHHRARP